MTSPGPSADVPGSTAELARAIINEVRSKLHFRVLGDTAALLAQLGQLPLNPQLQRWFQLLQLQSRVLTDFKPQQLIELELFLGAGVVLDEPDFVAAGLTIKADVLSKSQLFVAALRCLGEATASAGSRSG